MTKNDNNTISSLPNLPALTSAGSVQGKKERNRRQTAKNNPPRPENIETEASGGGLPQNDSEEHQIDFCA